MRAGDKVQVLNAQPDNDTVNEGEISRLHGSVIPVGTVHAMVSVRVVVGADSVHLDLIHLYATRAAADHYVEQQRKSYAAAGLGRSYRAPVAYLR